MSDTMKRNAGNESSGSSGGSSSQSGKSIRQMWDEYNRIADSIREKKDQLSKPENSMDLPTIKASISSLYLRAASLCINFASLAKEDKAVEKELIELGNRENIVEILEKRTEVYFTNARKYGSSVKSGTPTTTLDDIKGQEDVKEVVRSFVFLAKHPSLFDTYKIKGGLGLMMYGAPGTGKTMFAEAIANAMQRPLFVISPADLFKSYVGASEQAVRQIFDDISAFSDGAILFVDECESIFSRRAKDTKDYKSAVTSELLQRMNGQGVDGSRRIMVAATNLPWEIDAAYLRYKRFSHMVHITPPDMQAIESIVRSKLKGVPVEEGLEEFTLDMINKKLNPPDGERCYCSAADVCGIVENACRMAVEAMVKENQGRDDNLQVIKVSKDMIRKALDKFNPSITEKVKAKYDNLKPGEMPAESGIN